MTQYLLSVYNDPDMLAEVGEDEWPRLFAQVEEFNENVRTAGAWVFAGGLHPQETATVVRTVDGKVVTSDGPYLKTKEYLGGFWIIEAPDLDAALTWARQATVACEGPVEVRPFQDEPAADEA
ncbi:MAG TPA: YciI family protein [Kineosporiaceae bacterium]|nr:YciI family protein [Kineosporiaceae bacterium]